MAIEDLDLCECCLKRRVGVPALVCPVCRGFCCDQCFSQDSDRCDICIDIALATREA